MDHLTSTIEDLRTNPPNLLGNTTTNNQEEYLYSISHQNSYQRTISDIINFIPTNSKVLELGAFIGVVSRSLKKIGYNIIASDIPEFFNNEWVSEYYKKHGIPIYPINLRKAKLPFPDNELDAILICETLEHLNFNPLPSLYEMNRVLSTGGTIYVAMPNLSRIGNRIKMLLGMPIYSPIEDYLKQLSRDENMIAGLHWREYTIKETQWMLETVGFEVTHTYFFSEQSDSILRKLINLIPSFRQTQVVIAKKKCRPNLDFWITEVNS